MLNQTQMQNINQTTTKLVEQKQAQEQENSKPTFFKANPDNYSFEGRTLGASIGIIGGVAYAFKTKSGFLKGLGYWLLGSIVVGGLGYGVGTLVKKKKK